MFLLPKFVSHGRSSEAATGARGPLVPRPSSPRLPGLRIENRGPLGQGRPLRGTAERARQSVASAALGPGAIRPLPQPPPPLRAFEGAPGRGDFQREPLTRAS